VACALPGNAVAAPWCPPSRTQSRARLSRLPHRSDSSHSVNAPRWRHFPYGRPVARTTIPPTGTSPDATKTPRPQVLTIAPFGRARSQASATSWAARCRFTPASVAAQVPAVSRSMGAGMWVSPLSHVPCPVGLQLIEQCQRTSRSPGCKQCRDGRCGLPILVTAREACGGISRRCTFTHRLRNAGPFDEVCGTRRLCFARREDSSKVSDVAAMVG
jgi:hypothetical protein